jgi:hypothetical protein
MSPRTKHIAVKYHFFREKVDQFQIRVVHIDSAENSVDAFTKGLPEATFNGCAKRSWVGKTHGSWVGNLMGVLLHSHPPDERESQRS